MVTGRIAIIPARGGSKRILRKNLSDLGGQPMIYWTIKAALETAMFDQVVVSTDDPEIASAAKSFGASVPFLRGVAADDFSPVSEATVTALLQSEEYWKCRFETVVQLMPNCPFRGARHIRDALAVFASQERVFQISCFEYGWMNPWWAVTLSEDGTPSRIFNDAFVERSQDLPKLFCPTGAVWIGSRDQLVESRSFYGPGHKFQPVHWLAAFDIDSMSDLEMARHLWSKEYVNGTD